MDVVEFDADAYVHRKQVDDTQLYNHVPQTAWVSGRVSSVRVAVAVAVRVTVPVGDKMPE